MHIMHNITKVIRFVKRRPTPHFPIKQVCQDRNYDKLKPGKLPVFTPPDPEDFPYDYPSKHLFR